MGYSGLIYAAIVAAWAAFLVPRWVRRNEEVEQAAETDTVRGVRVLQRRSSPAVRSGHGRLSATLLHGRAEGLVIGAAVDDELGDTADGSDADHSGTPAEAVSRGRSGEHLRVPDPVAEVDAAFAAAAGRRRRLLVALLLALVAAAVMSLAGLAPLAAPVAVGGLLLLFLVVARRAAVAQAARRRVAVRRAAAVAERLAAPEADDDSDAGLTADGKRIAVYEPPETAEIDPDAWEPVAVPRPTYLDKALAPAPRARSINLQTPGAWTSGRLDPAGSIELPPQRRHPVAAPEPAETGEAEIDESAYPERRRAVGD